MDRVATTTQDIFGAEAQSPSRGAAGALLSPLLSPCLFSVFSTVLANDF